MMLDDYIRALLYQKAAETLAPGSGMPDELQVCVETHNDKIAFFFRLDYPRQEASLAERRDTGTAL